ncbi:MAG: hybrid sensor histidine kinase/response regulator [Bacteroidetes bacterium]|nr:hybrid sensor histidine kinase/response regulator [Bacteroidota bacterium]
MKKESDNNKKKDEIEKKLEALQKANEAKDKFISILSHDLRAPFTSILGFSEILINEPLLPNSEKLEYLNYIHEASENQLQLINYLLDWSRLQTGRMKIAPQKLNAQALIYNCVSSLTGNAIRKNININVEADENLFIQADERLLMQVITNLVSNAIKFSSSDKEINISAKYFNLDLSEFVVKDQGIGISDINKEKLFKIDKMFTTEGTNGEKGTGLGLSLVKEIIEKHGGNLWFYSEQGKGSEFHFTIPNSRENILLVINKLEEKKQIELIVKKKFSNYHIQIMDNGYSAYSSLLQNPPSLVIAQHNLPLMDALQLVKLIRKEERGNRLPIIIIIEDLNKEIKKQYNELSVTSFIKKPIDEDLIAGEIKTHLH